MNTPRTISTMSTFLAEAGLLDNVPTTARSIVSYVKKTVMRLYNWFSVCSLYSHNRARCSLSKFSASGIHSFTQNLLSTHLWTNYCAYRFSMKNERLSGKLTLLLTYLRIFLRTQVGGERSGEKVSSPVSVFPSLFCCSVCSNRCRKR